MNQQPPQPPPPTTNNINSLLNMSLPGNDNNNNNNSSSSNQSKSTGSSSTSSSSRSTSISQSQAGSFATQSPNYRSITLIDSLQFKFDGNISKHGIILADCDNDEKNELLIGTLHGELYIYKDSSTLPLAAAKDLGMISCIVVGDILNKEKNCIITISIEGYLNVFSLSVNYDYIEAQSASLNPVTAVRRSSNFSLSAPLSNLKLPPTITDNEEYSSSNNLISLHFQQIQANALCAVIADIDNDGQNEFIVALSDRVVRSYRTIYQGDDMKLVGIHKWEFSDQIGSITLSTCADSNPDESVDQNNGKRKCVLVAQNGGVYAKLNCFDVINDYEVSDGSEENFVENETENEKEPSLNGPVGLTPEYRNITLPPQRNPQISTEIISNIVTCSKEDESCNLIGVATADGLLMLLDEENIRWQCQLEQKVLSLKKHDIDNDGRDEFVLCTWNGQTYFVNLDGRIVTCKFEQPVSAFAVGHYDLNGQRMSCLAYGTYTNTVHLFYNIDCSFSIDTSENVFLDFIRSNNPPLMDQLERLVRKLNVKDDDQVGAITSPSSGISSVDSDEISRCEFKLDSRLIHAILYGIPESQAKESTSDVSRQQQK